MISPAWVPPRTQLSFHERDGSWLCLNPSVPSWIVTDRFGVLLLRLANGRRSLRDIAELLEQNQTPLRREDVYGLFRTAEDVGLFVERPSVRPGSSLVDRRLAALHLHLTDRCNLECTYCVRRSNPRIPIRTPAKRFCEMLRFLEPFTAERMNLTLTGGEPLIFPGFEQVVEVATELGYHKSLLTNGIAIDAERADFLAQHIDDIKISIDGPDEESHAAHRGAGHFDKVVRNIRMLEERGLKPNVQVTVTQSNIDRCAETLDLLDGANITFTPLLPMGRGELMAPQFVDNRQFIDLSRAVQSAQTRRARRAEEPSSEPPIPSRVASIYVPGQQSRGCHAGSTNLSVADNGDVHPCHLFQYQRFRLGNVFADSFAEIFCGEQVRAYVDSMDVEANNSTCRECDVRFLCGGGCKANALHATGDHRGIDSYCEYLRENIIDQLLQGCSETPGGHSFGLGNHPGCP